MDMQLLLRVGELERATRTWLRDRLKEGTPLNSREQDIADACAGIDRQLNESKAEETH